MSRGKNRFLTTTHAGQRLGVSPFRAAQLFDSGQLLGMRDSAGRRLITEESVANLARRRARAVAPAKDGPRQGSPLEKRALGRVRRALTDRLSQRRREVPHLP